MATIKRTTECFVKIEIKDPRAWSKEHATEQQWREAAKEIVEQVRRHVDVYDPSFLTVETDTRDICSFCESRWEVDSVGNPECCEEAQKEFKQAKEKAAATA